MFQFFPERWRWQGPVLTLLNSVSQLLQWQKTLKNIHTLTLDDWDAKHGYHRWLAMVAIPKRLLPCRAFVTDLCGVNVPWSYSENRPWTSLKLKFGRSEHELHKPIHFVTFCGVCLVWGYMVGFDSLVNLYHLYLYIYTYIYISSKSIGFMQWRQLAVFSCRFFSLFSFFSEIPQWLYCFRYLCSRFMNFGIRRFGRDCKETFKPIEGSIKKMCLLYIWIGNGKYISDHKFACQRP